MPLFGPCSVLGWLQLRAEREEDAPSSGLRIPEHKEVRYSCSFFSCLLEFPKTCSSSCSALVTWPGDRVLSPTWRWLGTWHWLGTATSGERSLHWLLRNVLLGQFLRLGSLTPTLHSFPVALGWLGHPLSLPLPARPVEPLQWGRAWGAPSATLRDQGTPSLNANRLHLLLSDAGTVAPTPGCLSCVPALF